MKLDRNKVILLIVIILALVFPLFFNTGYTLQFGINILMYAMAAVAWNIIGGYAGQLALGNGIYFGIGCFVSAILFEYEGISPWLGMIIAGLVAGAISLLLGFATFRLRGSYYALSTVALLFVIKMLFTSQTYILGYKTNGALGLTIPWRTESFMNMMFMNKTWYYYIIFGLLVVTLLISNWINKSKLGYYLAAINTNPEAAASLGVNVMGCKLIAGFVAAFLTAVCGTFYVFVIQIADPARVMGYDLSVQILLYAIVGGLGTLWGPVLGAALLVPLNDLLRAQLGASMAGLSTCIYGIVFCLIVFFMPEGIWGTVSRFVNRMIDKLLVHTEKKELSKG